MATEHGGGAVKGPLTPGVGDTVLLYLPENERLHGAEAVVTSTYEWGAHVAVLSSGMGHFRALWSEMVPTGTAGTAWQLAVRRQRAATSPPRRCVRASRNGRKWKGGKP